MKTQFETAVSEAFRARAAAVPSDAAVRLRGFDYRPRDRRLRVPATAGVLAGVATAGTVITVVALGGAPAAYAGWSPTPSSAATAPTAATDTSCQGQLRSGTWSGGGAWQTVLTDVRGPFTVALFQNDDAFAACFTSASFTQVNQISSDGSSGASSGEVSVHAQSGSAGGPGSVGEGQSSVSIGSTSDGDLRTVTQNHLTTGDGPYTLVDGRTAPGITGVTLVRDDGQNVVATVADGWFVAWWPASATATSAQVTSAAGTTTEQIEGATLPPPGTCPPQSQSAAGSGSVSCSGSGNSGNSGGGAQG
jgi:hypothetical protein